MLSDRPVRILCVEDDRITARLLQRRLERANYSVDVAHDGQEGLSAWNSREYHLLTVDQDMPNMTGLEMIRAFASKGELPPTVMITGAGNESIAVEAMKLGAADYIIKDSDARYLDLIPAVIERALQNRKMLEDKRKSDEVLCLSQEIAHIGSWELDLRTGRLSLSEEAYRILGFEPELCGPTQEAFVQVIHPDDRDVAQAAYLESIKRDAGNHEIEFRIVKKDSGEIRHVFHKWEHFRDGSGKIARSVGMVQDITDRKVMEQSFQHQVVLVESLLEAVPAPVFFKDTRQVYVGCNSAFARFIGLSKEEILGRSVFDVAPSELASLYRSLDETLFDRRGSQVYEAPVTDSFGVEHEVVFHKATYTDPSGNTAGLIGVVLDITERKRAERELRAATEKLCERVKEQKCLYSILKLLEIQNTSLEEILQGVVDLIPLSWPQPEHTCARIVIDDLEFKTANFAEHGESHVENIVADDTVGGTVEVYHPAGSGDPAEDLAFEGDESLLRAIAEQVGGLLDRFRKQERTISRNALSHNALEALPHPIYVVKVDDLSVEMANLAAREAGLSGDSKRYPLISNRDGPRTGEDLPSPLEQVVETRKPVTVEQTHCGADGVPRSLEVHAYPLFDERGNVTRVVECCLDISDRKAAEEALRASEKRLRLIADSLPALVSQVGIDQRFTFANKAYRDWFSVEPDETIGRHVSEVVGEDLFNEARPYMEAALSGRCASFEGSFDSSGKKRRFKASFVPDTDEDRLVRGYFTLVSDTTERKQTERALKQSEESYQALFNATTDAVFVYEAKSEGDWGDCLQVNDAACRYLGYTREELLRMSPQEVDDPDSGVDLAPISRALAMGQDVTFEQRHLSKDGRSIPVEIHSKTIELDGRPAVISLVRDISDRKAAEERTKASLKEKEVLLREIHHRVKNNLAVIGSLVGLHADHCNDENARALFEDCGERIRSISMVHQLLHGSDNPTTVNVGEYLARLARELAFSRGDLKMAIDIRTEIEELHVGPDVAIPLGLIVTELTTNALKHAFVGLHEGVIRLALRSTSEGQYELTVSDDGVGTPSSVTLENPESIGLDLVDSLALQLNGACEILRGKGTTVRVLFNI